jgi:hypothetical protein
VREAFRARGHNAFSCDIIPAEDSQEFHFLDDALMIAREYPWDLMVCHPPCTHLSVSGARHFKTKKAYGLQQAGIEFALALWNMPIPRIALENPVSVLASHLPKDAQQIIQPWQFGHFETKTTCLWLKGLPKLVPTDETEGRAPRVFKMAPGPDRWKDRSRTFQGIADAMAAQWGSV